MPRPRILGSPRSRPRIPVKSEEATPEVVTISDFEEPDCEIIKIEEDEEQNAPMRMAVHGVAEVQFCGSKLLPSMLSLQLLPNTSTKMVGNAGGQNVVMVMPMSAASSQVFNPTLCTLQKIENPTEITQIQRVVGMQRNADASDARRGESARKMERTRQERMKETREKQLKEMREKQLKEQREKELKEQREKELKEQREKELKEQREKELKEQREKELKEQREKQLNETREKELKETREKQLKETREKQLKETREKQLKETREKQLNEMREKQLEEAREKQLKESRERQIKESREKLLQTIFVHNSAENQRLISESRVSGSVKTPKSAEIRVKTETEDNDHQSPSTSVIASCDSAAGPRDEDELRNRTLESLLDELPDASCTENETDELFSPQKFGVEIRRKRPVPRISSSESSSCNASSLANEATTVSTQEKSANFANIPEYKRLTFQTREPTNTEGSSKTRKNLCPVVDLGVRITVKHVARAAEANNSEESEQQFSLHMSTTASRRSSANDANSYGVDEQPIDQIAELTSTENSGENLEISSSSFELRSRNEEISTTLKTRRPERSSWKLQCIVCQESFTDRMELHRHATLAHPNVQILFCDLCSESFLTHAGLKAHRVDRCGSEISEIVETIVIEGDDSGRTSKESAAQRRKRSAAGRSKRAQMRRLSSGISNATAAKLQIRRASGAVNSASAKLQIRRLSGGVKVKSKRRPGRPPKNYVKRTFVEREVANHAVAAKRKDLGGAEIKQLVVPVKPLTGPTLAKYLEKRAEEPVTEFQSEGLDGSGSSGAKKTQRRRGSNWTNRVRAAKSRRKFGEGEKSAANRSAKKLTREKRPARKKSLGDVVEAKDDSDRTADFSRELRSIDSDSDDYSGDAAMKYVSIVYASESEVNRVIGVETDDDLGSEERPVIRKLPSRSSAASLLLLRAEQAKGTSFENGEFTSSAKSSVSRARNIEKSGKLAERSSAGSANDSLEEFDPEQFEKSANDGRSFGFEGDENRRKIGADLQDKSAGESAAQKTYLPSGRRAAIAKKSKRPCEETSRELCMMCSELFELMRQLAGKFVGGRANKMSVKCPLCSLHFISMFFLKKHIANHHLQCLSEKPCNSDGVSPSVRSASSSAALDCETEVALAKECQHCREKFAEEKDLVDHVFALHDLPIFSRPEDKSDVRHFEDDRVFPKRDLPIFPGPENDNDLPHFVDDPAAPSTSRGTDGNAENPPIARRASGERSAESVDAEVAGNSERARNSSLNLGAEEQKRGARECHVCRKVFTRSPDLLDHSLGHESNVPESDRNAPDDSPIVMTAPFADSLDYNWNDAQLESSALESRAEDSGTAAPISVAMDVDREIGDDIFASGDENNDFSRPDRSDEDAIIEGGANRRGNAICTTDKSTTRDRKTKRRVPISEKSAPEVAEPRNKRAKATQPLRKTEDDVPKTEEKIASGKQPIECGKCNRKFPNQEALNEHLFFLHDDSIKDTVLTDVVAPTSRPGDGNREPRQWRCDKCSHNFKLLQSYRRHRYFVHRDDEFVHVCENCCKVLTSVTMVNVHICTDVASYNCRTCNETFDTGFSLRLHNMYRHKETEGPHVCYPCDKRFLTSAMLKRHEKWEHRFLRPYRPRKRSPVRMATPDEHSTKIRATISPRENSDDRPGDDMDSGCDEEYPEMEYEFTGLEIPERKRKSGVENSRARATRAKNRPRETPIAEVEISSVSYVKEDDIFQCDLCRLFCLSMSALRSHRAACHATLSDVCRVCEKKYPRGKLVRHMIDRHISPCETYVESGESIWTLGRSIEEKDAEELIGMLGMTRFISLCEYQRFGETGEEESVVCPTCGKNIDDREAYKVHFLEEHDVMCALCNIEFKSGDKAAIHKIEDHGSVESYVWFADETVAALTAATNFSELAEKNFIEMISRSSDEESDEPREDKYGDVEESETCGDIFESGDGKENGGRWKTERSENSEMEPAEVEKEKLVIVVNDEDIVKYGIGTESPNIWGLASKISSTSEDLTPMDVKAMLESYFET